MIQDQRSSGIVHRITVSHGGVHKLAVNEERAVSMRASSARERSAQATRRKGSRQTTLN
jgi:hypothetical protein